MIFCTFSLSLSKYEVLRKIESVGFGEFIKEGVKRTCSYLLFISNNGGGIIFP